MTDNVTDLADYGLIALKENRRAKRPVVWYARSTSRSASTRPMSLRRESRLKAIDGATLDLNQHLGLR